MRVQVLASADAVAEAAARRVRNAIRKKPDLVLGLPTGRTPVALYARLARMHARGEVDFSRVTTFNLDEFAGIPASHPGSYRAFMDRHFFAHVNVPRRRIHFLKGDAADVGAELLRYDTAIERAGGIDLQILGLGGNGHVGFNEPAKALDVGSHLVRLHRASRKANAALFGGRLADVPEQAMTVGMRAILAARCVLLMAVGEEKADAVAEMANGLITTRLPASFLQTHRDVDVLLDPPAAARIRRRR